LWDEKKTGGSGNFARLIGAEMETPHFAVGNSHLLPVAVLAARPRRPCLRSSTQSVQSWGAALRGKDLSPRLLPSNPLNWRRKFHGNIFLAKSRGQRADMGKKKTDLISGFLFFYFGGIPPGLAFWCLVAGRPTLGTLHHRRRAHAIPVGWRRSSFSTTQGKRSRFA